MHKYIGLELISMRITVVGSSAGVPTSEYGTSGIFAQVGEKSILFDCGEGTQKRLMKYDCSINVDSIFLTHFDSDHTLGLPGLIRTLEMNNRDRPLDIYASNNIIDNLKVLIAGSHGIPSYDVNIVGFGGSENTIAQYNGFEIKCFKTEHDNSSYGYIVNEEDRTGKLNADKIRKNYDLPPGPKFEQLKKGNKVTDNNGNVISPDDVVGPKRSGRKFVYTGDCRASRRVIESSQNADLLIHESTFHSNDKQKAVDAKHSTSLEAANVASKSDSDHLVLTHISPRYEGDEKILIDEAKKEFDGKISIGRDGFSTVITLE